MHEKLSSDAGRKIHAQRTLTFEPMFEIIKSVTGLWELLLRGLDRVASEWSLVCLAHNIKRLYALRRAKMA